jgi:hypothetical protein
MSLPSTMPTLPVPASRPLPAPGAHPPVPSRHGIGTLARRAFPAMRASLTVVAVGVAVEYALRALANRAFATVLASREVLPIAAPVAMRTRVVVTEFVIRERIRRVR